MYWASYMTGSDLMGRRLWVEQGNQSSIFKAFNSLPVTGPTQRQTVTHEGFPLLTNVLCGINENFIEDEWTNLKKNFAFGLDIGNFPWFLLWPTTEHALNPASTLGVTRNNCWIKSDFTKSKRCFRLAICCENHLLTNNNHEEKKI